MALFSRPVARKQNRDSRAIEALTRALADPDRYARENAVKSLGMTGEPAAVPALLRALADREEVVRSRAANALGEIANPAAVELYGYAHEELLARTVADLRVRTERDLVPAQMSTADADGALFPYETVDKLHDGHHHTGPITLLRVRGARGVAMAWEPLSARSAEDRQVERNLYKNVVGNRLVFEEIHHGLGLAFRYRWSGCDAFGLVRTATLENPGRRSVTVEVLDGLRNVLPHGAPLALYQQSSCLVDAYKQSECDAQTGLGLFALTAEIVDRAEPAEELRANTVWCHGLPHPTVCLSLDAVAAFLRELFEIERRHFSPQDQQVCVLSARDPSQRQIATRSQPPARQRCHIASSAACF